MAVESRREDSTRERSRSRERRHRDRDDDRHRSVSGFLVSAHEGNEQRTGRMGWSEDPWKGDRTGLSSPVLPSHHPYSSLETLIHHLSISFSTVYLI